MPRRKKKSRKQKQSKKAKSSLESRKADPPAVVQIDITPQLYEQIKEDTIRSQHPLVRPYIESFISYLKQLDPLDVYEAIERGITIKDFFDKPGNYELKITVAAARGLIKSSSRLREKANQALNPKFARIVLRFENPEVYRIIDQWGGDEFLEKNIDALKVILGIKKERRK